MSSEFYSSPNEPGDADMTGLPFNQDVDPLHLRGPLTRMAENRLGSLNEIFIEPKEEDYSDTAALLLASTEPWVLSLGITASNLHSDHHKPLAIEAAVRYEKTADLCNRISDFLMQTRDIQGQMPGEDPDISAEYLRRLFYGDRYVPEVPAGSYAEYAYNKRDMLQFAVLALAYENRLCQEVIESREELALPTKWAAIATSVAGVSIVAVGGLGHAMGYDQHSGIAGKLIAEVPVLERIQADEGTSTVIEALGTVVIVAAAVARSLRYRNAKRAANKIVRNNLKNMSTEADIDDMQ